MMRTFLKIWYWLLTRCLSVGGKLRLINFYQPIPQAGITIDSSNTQRVTRRWKQIEKNLPSEKLSVLDIGCNAGYYAINMAEKGHFVTGIESRKKFYLIANILKDYLGFKNLAYYNILLTPENVGRLPKYDCVFLLAVFHHWCRAYGAERALAMLDMVCRKTDKVMYFETGQSGKNYKDILPRMGDDVEQWLHDLFEKKGNCRVKTISDKEDSRYLLAVIKNDSEKGNSGQHKDLKETTHAS